MAGGWGASPKLLGSRAPHSSLRETTYASCKPSLSLKIATCAKQSLRSWNGSRRDPQILPAPNDHASERQRVSESPPRKFRAVSGRRQRRTNPAVGLLQQQPRADRPVGAPEPHATSPKAVFPDFAFASSGLRSVRGAVGTAHKRAPLPPYSLPIASRYAAVCRNRP